VTVRGPRSRESRPARKVVATLRALGKPAVKSGMARFKVPSHRAFGVSADEIRRVARTLGRDHELAAALWESGWYEARVLAALVDDPARVTPAQMDRWCADFDSWAVTDAACFHLFDRTPHALGRVRKWSTRRGEFQKRAAFALLAGLALHDRVTPDGPFERCLPLIEAAASDGRNFVKKGVSWALRQVGRRSPELQATCLALAGKLAVSEDRAVRWVGLDALRDLGRVRVTKSRCVPPPCAVRPRSRPGTRGA